MRRRVSVATCAFVAIATGVAGALASDDGAPEPPPPPTLSACVDAWNASKGSKARAWMTLADGVLVTRDAEDRCVVAVDSSMCGGPKDLAVAWVRVDGRWEPYAGRHAAATRRAWMRRVRKTPNAHFAGYEKTLKLGRTRNGGPEAAVLDLLQPPRD